MKRNPKRRIALSKWQVSQELAQWIQIAVAAHSAGRLPASINKALEVAHHKLMPLLRKLKKKIALSHL